MSLRISLQALDTQRALMCRRPRSTADYQMLSLLMHSSFNRFSEGRASRPAIFRTLKYFSHPTSLGQASSKGCQSKALARSTPLQTHENAWLSKDVRINSLGRQSAKVCCLSHQCPTRWRVSKTQVDTRNMAEAQPSGHDFAMDGN